MLRFNNNINLIFTLLITLNIPALVFAQSYKFCPGVSTVHISDPLVNRTIVINYNSKNSYYTFLRCGANDSIQSTNKLVYNFCYIYRSGYEDKLCKRERRVLSVHKVLINFIEFAGGAVITGGVKFTKSIKMINNLRIKPECIGLGLMKRMAQNSNDKKLFQYARRYYDFQTEVGILTQITRLSHRSAQSKTSYVISQLDNLLMGGHGSREIGSTGNRSTQKKLIKLKGPAYFFSHQNKKSSQLFVDTKLKNGFCKIMSTGKNLVH